MNAKTAIDSNEEPESPRPVASAFKCQRQIAEKFVRKIRLGKPSSSFDSCIEVLRCWHKCFDYIIVNDNGQTKYIYPCTSSYATCRSGYTLAAKKLDDDEDDEVLCDACKIVRKQDRKREDRERKRAD
jgi:Pyruvate/2-oxoacid:ferredoxin oxidoreductase delta subunit